MTLHAYIHNDKVSCKITFSMMSVCTYRPMLHIMLKWIQSPSRRRTWHRYRIAYRHQHSLSPSRIR